MTQTSGAASEESPQGNEPDVEQVADGTTGSVSETTDTSSGVAQSVVGARVTDRVAAGEPAPDGPPPDADSGDRESQE